MIATDARNRFVTDAQAQNIAERWNGVYPAMRNILDTVIKAQHSADRPTVDVLDLRELRAGAVPREVEAPTK